MTCNVGGIERGIRIVLGVILLAMGLFGGEFGGLAIALSVIGGVALVTGAVGFCPAWKIFGINTCAPKAQGQH